VKLKKRFSIIIPTYNRPQLLQQCLEGITRLETPAQGFEVIVVDDGSEASTEEITRLFLERLALQVIRQSNSGPALARNIGARHASGEWLVFLDDDCVPHPDWLRLLDEAATRHPDSLLGGRTRNACPQDVFAETNQLLVDTVVEWLGEVKSPLQFFTSNNLALSAKAFREIGGFDMRFRTAGGEDRELCSRWLKSGRTLAPAANAWIDHYHPQTLGSFLKMHFRYGAGAAQLHQRRHSSPMMTVFPGLYTRLVKTFLGASRDRRKLPLLVLSQVATVVGFFGEKIPQRPPRGTPAAAGQGE